MRRGSRLKCHEDEIEEVQGRDAASENILVDLGITKYKEAIKDA